MNRAITKLCPYIKGFDECSCRHDVPTMCIGRNLYLSVPVKDEPVSCGNLIELVIEWHKEGLNDHLDFCLTSSNEHKRKIVKHVLNKLEEKQNNG